MVNISLLKLTKINRVFVSFFSAPLVQLHSVHVCQAARACVYVLPPQHLTLAASCWQAMTPRAFE